MSSSRGATTDLTFLSNRELLMLERAILAKLKDRNVIRSNNAPVGDYAEYLVTRATGGALAAKAQKSWDVLTPDGKRLQVKARVLTKENPSRQLSPIRSWDFDHLVVVLFDDTFGIKRAATISAEDVRAVAVWKEHVGGWIVHARDDLLNKGSDCTNDLCAHAA
jgi:hypothetical protein